MNRFNRVLLDADFNIRVFQYFDDVANFHHLLGVRAFAHGHIVHRGAVNRQFVVEHQDLVFLPLIFADIQVQVSHFPVFIGAHFQQTAHGVPVDFQPAVRRSDGLQHGLGKLVELDFFKQVFLKRHGGPPSTYDAGRSTFSVKFLALSIIRIRLNDY